MDTHDLPGFVDPGPPGTETPMDWNNMRQVQQELTRWASEQFPNRTDHAALSKAVLEEIPELLRHKKEHGIEGIGDELADVFILFMDLATMWKVDLASAIQTKMGINYTRVWEVSPVTGIAQHVPHLDKPPEKAVYGCPHCSTTPKAALHATPAEMRAADTSDSSICCHCRRFFDNTIPF